MTIAAAVGYAQALDGREAALQATHQALNQLGSGSAALAIVISPYRYDAQQIISGTGSLLGNTPLLGFSTSASLTSSGQHQQGVAVALLSGTDIQVETHWFPSYAQASQENAENLVRSMSAAQAPASAALVFADGFNGDAEQLCAALPANLQVIGGLACGDPNNGWSYQISGTQSGTSSMSAAILRGKIKVGVGSAHGWNPVGNRYRVTRSRGFWLRTLDGRPVSETYSQMFGYPTREWAFPPLNLLTRIYPLGIEQGAGTELQVRSPIRVEADGSFRLNAPIRDGSDAYVMVGSPTSCKDAAMRATHQAMQAIGSAKPVFALVLADIAWQLLLQAKPGMEISAIQEIIGEQLPIIGGYTLGQIIPGDIESQGARFLNQNITVAVFAAQD